MNFCSHHRHHGLSALLLLFPLVHLLAQQTDLSLAHTSSKFTYIYRISNERVIDYYRHDGYLIPVDVTEIPVDSFFTDSGLIKNLPNGNYVFVHAKETNLHYGFHLINDFEVKLHRNYRELAVSVQDSSGATIENARLSMEGKELQFDPERKIYFLSKAFKAGLLAVEIGEEVECFNVTRSYPRQVLLRPIRRLYYYSPIDNIINGIRYHQRIFGGHHSRYSYSQNYNGYIVTNKPMYHPGDTVKMKAYLINKHQKPLKRKLVMVLASNNYRQRPVIRDTLSPITRGDYVTQFVLGDSLEIDRSYYISFHSLNGNQNSMNGEFRLEDYQLDETFYEVKMEKKNFISDNPVACSITSHDANGLALKDARIEILVLPRQFLKSYLPSQYVGDTLVHLHQMLDGDGSTEIILPDSLFPKAKMDLTLQCFFTNANNEVKDTTIEFSIDKPDMNVELKFDDAKFKAELIHNGKSLNAPGVLNAFDESNNLILKKTISFPYEEKINPLVYRYHVEYRHNEGWLDASQEEDKVRHWAARTFDSVFASVENPNRIPVNYEFYKSNHLLVRGIADSSFIFTLRDESALTYFFVYYYTWAGESKSTIDRAMLYDRSLNVELQQPAEVYPGEECESKIRVTDFEGKPVSNVNLTASAINSQFENFDLPALPEFSKTHGKFKSHNVYSLSQVETERYRTSNHLSARWMRKMKLDSSLYYQLVYPSQTLILHEEKIASTLSQFSAHLYHNGISSPIVMIYVDKQLMYYFNVDAYRPYSMVINPGYHMVRIISTRDEFEMDSVLFKAGLKLEMVIDPFTARDDSLVKVTDRNWRLTEEEISDLKNSLLFFNSPHSYSTVFVRDKNQIFKTSFSSYRKQTVCAGPFNENDLLTLIAPNHFSRSFLFRPQYEYVLDTFLIERNQKVYWNNVREKISPDIYSKRLPLGELAFTDADLIVKEEYKAYSSPFDKYRPDRNKNNNGSLRIIKTTDSTFYVFVLRKYSDGHVSYVLNALLPAHFDLMPGYYSLKFVTQSGNYLQADSILIKPGMTFWYSMVKHPFSHLDPSSNDFKRIFRPSEILHQNKQQPLRYEYHSGDAKLQGRVYDNKTNEGIPFAAVVVEMNGAQHAVGQTDENGNYEIGHLSPGTYNIRVQYIGYQPIILEGVRMIRGRISFQNIAMEIGSTILYEVCVVAAESIEPDFTSMGTLIERSEIHHIATRNVNNFASMTAGVFQRDNGTQYYIDGIKVRGYNLPQNAVEQLSIIDGGIPARYGDASGLLSINGSRSFRFELSDQQSAIREKFSDYAWWQPNLFTNDSGEVKFTVKFPDNITKWNAYAIAMSSKKMSGSGFTTTRASKKLVATLATPRFLVEGDESEVIGKTLNYTGESIPVKTSFEKDGKEIKSGDSSVNSILVESIPVNATSNDSISIIYSVHYEKYFDGEKQKIPVVPQGLLKSVGNFYVLNHDTNVIFTPVNAQAPVYFTAHATMLDVLKDDLRHLKEYEYDCNEQLASKLIADILLTQINSPSAKKALSPFARRIKNRLSKNQLSNGSWGWWEGGSSNIWMTCYVLHALHIAQEPNTHSTPVYRAIQFLRDKLSSIKSRDLIDALEALHEWKVNIDFEAYINRVHIDSADNYSLYRMMLLRKEAGEKVDLKKLLEERHETIFGNSYWGEENFTWYDNSIQLSLLAYKILAMDSAGRKFLPSISNYFLEQKRNKGYWRNTFESAQILKTIIPQFINEKSNYSSPVKLRINGHEDVITGNYFSKKKLSSASSYKIEKEGAAPLYVSCSQKIFEPEPKVKDDYFKIETSFITNERASDTLIAGKYSTLRVSVRVMKKSDYVMITIPIPAGCSYANKTVPAWNETHRQYFKDKAVIFCESLPEGNYRFDINLEARFKGAYTVNPAQVQLMYFPVFDGNNEGRKVKIY